MLNTFYMKSVKYNPHALQLILDAHKELIKNNLVDENYGHDIRTDDEAFILLKGTKVVGICTFYEWNTNYWISLSYVKPTYRNLGGWKALRGAVARRAKENKIKYVMSGVAKNNTASITANKSLGQEIVVMFKQSID